MDKKKGEEDKKKLTDLELNKGLEGVDKAPDEEDGKGEPVTNNDLKNKTVDADLEEEEQRKKQ